MIQVIQEDLEVTDEEITEIEEIQQRIGTIVAIGNITKYLACPSITCFPATLQEDGRCRACHKKPEKEADGLTAVLKIRQEEGNYLSAKAFTRTLSDFYTSVRPGCSILNKNIDEIEDKLFDILPVNAQYTVNVFNTPYTITTMQYVS